MLRRNVKITPLPGFGDVEALDVLAPAARDAPVLFGLPAHGGQRGSDQALRRQLQGGVVLRERFLGGNAEEMYARTGEPL